MISIDKFKLIANVKESTIKRNRNRIPGLSYVDGQYLIIDGTRYPCDLHRYKIKDSADRRYLLLKMISEYKYVTHVDLGLYYPQFVQMLEELLKAGLIAPNNMENHYGANFYDCTALGDELLKRNKEKAKNEIANLIASAAGTLIGRIISEVAA